MSDDLELVKLHYGQQAYLVSRGVRAMALLDPCVADPLTMLRQSTLIEGAASGLDVISFMIPRTHMRPNELPLADCGYAATQWVVDLFEWINNAPMPEDHFHQILGLLLGYSPQSISRFLERIKGRRFDEIPQMEELA